SETLFSSVLINTGSASDTVKVYATGKPTTIDGGGGQDYVIVGDPFNNAQYIQGALTVKNPPAGGYTTLYVNDYGESNKPIFTISESAITGLTPAPINYVQYDLKALGVIGSKGVNTVTIANTPTSGVGGGLYTTYESLNSGLDTVTVKGTTGPLVL